MTLGNKTGRAFTKSFRETLQYRFKEIYSSEMLDPALSDSGGGPKPSRFSRHQLNLSSCLLMKHETEQTERTSAEKFVTITATKIVLYFSKMIIVLVLLYILSEINI